MKYVLQKKSGSPWARVVDHTTKEVIRSFNILKGTGRNNGWERARQMVDQLNSKNR